MRHLFFSLLLAVSFFAFPQSALALTCKEAFFAATSAMNSSLKISSGSEETWRRAKIFAQKAAERLRSLNAGWEGEAPPLLASSSYAVSNLFAPGADLWPFRNDLKDLLLRTSFTRPSTQEDATRIPPPSLEPDPPIQAGSWQKTLYSAGTFFYSSIFGCASAGASCDATLAFADRERIQLFLQMLAKEEEQIRSQRQTAALGLLATAAITPAPSLVALGFKEGVRYFQTSVDLKAWTKAVDEALRGQNQSAEKVLSFVVREGGTQLALLFGFDEEKVSETQQGTLHRFGPVRWRGRPTIVERTVRFPILVALYHVSGTSVPASP